MFNNYKHIGLVLFVVLFVLGIQSTQGQDTLTYKKAPTGESLRILSMKVNNRVSNERSVPAFVLLSGGGWVDFSWSQLKDLAKLLTQSGAKAYVIEYRTSKLFPDATPMDALDDVHDAIFYLRNNAQELSIDPKNIVAIGSSAGAHLAYTACLSNPRKLAPISKYQPNFIVAYSPVVRNDIKGYAFDRIGAESAAWFSPWNVYMETSAQLPPSIIFSGEKDPLIKIADLEEFVEVANRKGDIMRLEVFEDVGHSMRNTIPDIYDQTGPIILAFLDDNGFRFESQKSRLPYVGAGVLVGLSLFLILVYRHNKKAKSQIS